MIAAAQLPDLRARLVDELTRELGDWGPIQETYRIHTVAGAQIPAHPDEADPVAQARALARHEQERLARAALYWVSPHMTALTHAAAPGMPPFRPGPGDLPAPYGLVYFAAPIAEADETPVAELAVFSDGTTKEIPGGRFQVTAATWGPWDYHGRWTGGTWFTFYTAGSDRPGAPPLRLDNECVVGAEHDGSGPDGYAELVSNSTGTLGWVHLILASFRLMATSRAAQVSMHGAVRPVRRRAARAGVARPDEPVRLVDVTARPRAASDEPREDGRNYRVRWIVDGHWRNQWYPGSGVHRPRYIDAHVKGPEGAPLRVKETVRVWRDPAEPVGG